MNILFGKIYKNKNFNIYVIPYKSEDDYYVFYRRLDEWDMEMKEPIVYFNRMYVLHDD